MRLAVTIVSATVAVVAVAALGMFLWLRAYAPLAAQAVSVSPGPGLGADVEPTFGSGGKTVFIPAYRKGRPFDVAFTVENTGRFAVTLTGLTAIPSGPLYADKLLATDVSGSADPGHLRPFHALRLDPKDSAIIAVEWHLDCKRDDPDVATDSVRLRYRYLSMFSRTQSVVLPFAVTLRCSGGPPASP